MATRRLMDDSGRRTHEDAGVLPGGDRVAACRSQYAGLKDRIGLRAGAVTVFRSGNVLLRYRPPGHARNLQLDEAEG